MPVMRRKKRKEDHLSTDYINNKTFYAALKDWYEKKKVNPEAKVPDILVLAIFQICENLSKKYNFSNYSYIDEMIDAAREKCINALMHQKFDPEKYQNPFAYFTTVAWYEFITIIKDEQKESYIKHASLANHYHQMSLDPANEVDVQEFTSLEDINWGLIEKFQPKPRKGKKKAGQLTEDKQEPIVDESGSHEDLKDD